MNDLEMLNPKWRELYQVLGLDITPVTGRIVLTAANGASRTYDLPSGNLTSKYDPIVLPDKPGTIIAIGEWWFVRLRPYEPGVDAAWELLPAPKDVADRIERMGIKTQHVYSDEWVLAEAEQEGSFKIISRPAVTR